MARDPDKERDYQDQLLCKLALERGLLSVRQLKAAFNDQQKEVLDGKLHPRSLEAVLRDEGVLTDEQLRKLHQELKVPPVPEGPPRFGPFELGPLIGRGPRGEIFEATDSRTALRVALKILSPPPTTDPGEIREAEDRFVRETRTVVAIPPHPGIVRVFETGVIDGRRYLSMELVSATPLSEWRKTGARSVRLQVSMLRDVALALHHAHAHRVSHRSLKPENILVDAQNCPRVVDFGLAHALGDQASVKLSSSGSALAYVSPEEIEGRPGVDRRADLYALGVLLYEIIAGRKPFEGAAPFEMIERTLSEPVVPPSRVTTMILNPAVFANLEGICLIAMARDPAARYADAQGFADDLTRWLSGEERKEVVPITWRTLRARRSLKVAGALAAGLLAGVLGGAWWMGGASGDPSRADGNGAVAEMAELAPPVAYRFGAVRQVFAGIDFNAAGPRALDRRPAFAVEGERAWPGHFVSVRWEGFLEIDRAGAYEFVVESADGARLFVDGQAVVSNWTAHAATANWGRARLEPGFRPFRLEYFHSGSERLLKVAWKPEGREALMPLGPVDLYHDPADLPSGEEPAGGGPAGVAGAREAETLEVLGCSGVFPEFAPFAPHAPYREGTWSGPVYLRWGRGVRVGDRLRLGLVTEKPASSIALALTRGPDHGIYRIAVNGSVLAEALDLYAPRLSSGEVRLEGAVIREGFNSIDFTAVGSNPAATEWSPGEGARILGLDYVRLP